MIRKLIEFLAELIHHVFHDPYQPPDLIPQKPKPISKLTRWAEAHKLFEAGMIGGKPDPNAISIKRNNPGNIKNLQGEFIQYPTYEAGWNALLDYLTRAATDKHLAYVQKAKQLKLKSSGDLTVLQFIEVYTFGDGADIQKNYAAFICKHCGVPLSTTIKELL